MDFQKAQERMKKKGKVFQVIGITNASKNVFYVFGTKKAANKFVEEQDFLATYQIVEINVFDFK